VGVEQRQLDSALRAIRVKAWRLHLETPGVVATVPMLRGVWGAALRAESEACYCRLFEGAESERPRYLMRPAPQVAQPAPAVEFLLFPATTNLLDDRDDEEIAWTAWDRACRQGLGPHRHPFRISSVVPLAWDGSALEPARRQPGFVLEDLPWPAGTEETPCRLEFPAPLRLLRQGKLIASPTPADIVLAALHRVCALAGPDTDPLWAARRYWLELGRAVPFEPWQGRRLDLVRYSGSQKAEVELRGVAGSLALPVGPGPLSPLLAAAAWIHIGKGTVMGLGQIKITACDRVGSEFREHHS
jgi:CRISPR-associated endoribonuclease Cas6